jgi:hypothetical protein
MVAETDLVVVETSLIACPKGTAMLCARCQRVVMCELGKDKRVTWPLPIDITKLDCEAIALVETR